jgi:hypothetical protein
LAPPACRRPDQYDIEETGMDDTDEFKARFVASRDLTGLPEPKPGYAMWPQWFKKLDQRLPQESDEFLKLTVKACAPFADAMSAGYVMRLPAAVRVDHNLTTGEINFNWSSGRPLTVVEAAHSLDQVEGSELKFPFKWLNYFALQLPEGWSALYTHPINRHDLPFRTLTGLVDDPYRSPVSFPFEWIGTEEEIFLDAGTPIAQVIPIQRVAWRAEVDYVPAEEVARDGNIVVSHLQGYRRKYRRQKIYR